MGTNFYIVCKCCGNQKVHLGKRCAAGNGMEFLSNFDSPKRVIAAAKALEKNEALAGGGERISFAEFRKRVLECKSFEKVEGGLADLNFEKRKTASLRTPQRISGFSVGALAINGASFGLLGYKH